MQDRQDEPEEGKSRLHIDVDAADRDQDAEPERLLELGARPAETSAGRGRSSGTP